MNRQDLLSRYSQERTRCTIYTRVMGYHRPVETFNVGKQGEFHDRKHFIEPPIVPISSTFVPHPHHEAPSA